MKAKAKIQIGKGVLAFALLLLALAPRASASTNVFGALTTVTGTTNSASYVIGNVTPPNGTFFISNGGLGATNNLTVNLQLTLDNTNFLTCATWIPTVTNAQTITFGSSYTNQPIYFRVQIVSGANTNQVGIIQQ